MWRVGIWEESFRCADILYFAIARWKLCASTTFEILPLSTCTVYTIPEKILYLQRCSTDFRILRLSPKMSRFGIWVESFKCAGILLLQWQGENFASRQHLKFCHFQPVHCVSKNPIAPKLFNRFSKSLPQLEDVEGGHLGGKFQVRRYITFAMARWKLCASYNIWNYPKVNLYTVPAKILYLQRYSTDFRNLCLSSKILRVGIWVESFKRAGILILQWQGENLAHVQHLKFPTFNLSTVTAKILYLQRYSTDFRNLWLSSKMLREGICVERFKRAGIILLQWQGENLAHVQHLKFPTFNLYTVTAKILYFQRYSTDFRNLCFSSKMLTVGICVENCRCADMVLLQWQGENFAHRQHLKFPTFKMHTVPAKILYLQWYSTDFRNLCLSTKILLAGSWVESFRRAVMVLLQWHGENFAHVQQLKFPTSNKYTAPAKILHMYIQRYSTDFRNLNLSWKMLRMGISLESFRCADIVLLQWQGEYFAHWQHLKLRHFQHAPCASKNPLSPKVFNRFSKSLPHLEDVEVGISVESFRCADIVLLQWQGEYFAHWQRLKFPTFNM